MIEEYYNPIVRLLFVSSIATIVLTFIFRYISKYIGAIAVPNKRSSHTKVKPTGGGIIISSVFVCSIIYYLFYIEQVSPENFTIFIGISLGGLAISIVGFFDDLSETRAMTKLIIQIILSLWIIYIFLGNLEIMLKLFAGVMYWPLLFLGLFILVWLINVFNFMDAIDGMALSGTTLVAICAGALIFLLHGHNENSIILFILGVICLSFLLFNFPPASIFMGDSGSLFLGYFYGCIIVKTLVDNDLTLWTWMILLSHFLVETTLSTLLRVKLTRKWYKAHRALAYQNLARILNSHTKVTLGAIVHYIVWLFPLAFLSTQYPELAPLFLFLGFIPSVIVTIRFGPLFSNQ